MTTPVVRPSPAGTPTPAQLFVFADQEITAAVAEQWPHAQIRLGHHVPSVTGYVRRVHINGRALYAKYSFLGISLVSLLRGAGGPWPEVRDEQRAYVQRPDALMDREAAQLRLLARLPSPRVCQVAGLRRGVLLTEAVDGPSLAQLLVQQPQHTADFYAEVFTQLRPLHRSPASSPMGPAPVIAERSIAATFQRKFNGLSGPTYLRHLGAERCPPAVREEVTETLRHTVARLHRLRAAMHTQSAQRVLVYGDLKPEHILFPDGTGHRPVFIDPGLQSATATADTAKLVSRSALALATARPGTTAAQHAVHGIHTFTAKRLDPLAGKARRTHVHRLVGLWLMDSINILTTYLTAPPALPLPAHGSALAARAVPVCRMLEATSNELAAGTDPHTVWENALLRTRALAA
ncbi:phosphotransferase [Streptomyces sp. NBC_01187]|uniref:phosphotransferase n=1 Tax=Streptomyces sp. NBC_01187 TaxID=2903766 RepID=UPI003869568F|nr:aminoglycoside phosphotransferase family protein [Streptomyces sp. NBC_01187]